MVDFTVAIPTYNGAHRLPDVLAKLRSQENIPATLVWEVIVVDNNSHDETAQVVQRLQAHFPCLLRYCFEHQQGAAYARQHAIRVARGALVGFLDDDNLPDPGWVAAAYAFAQMHPPAGAYASQIRGEFEVEPPPRFRHLLPFLAITERGSIPLKYNANKRLLPPAAGLVVRRSVWLAHVPTQPILNGRTANNMLAGEDLEVLIYIQQAGWEIWYNPAMKIAHKIPAWRLERTYLIPFFRGIGLSRWIPRTLGIHPVRRSLLFCAYLLNDLRKIIWHVLKYRTQIRTDLVAACEMELLLSSLISPIYLWKEGYFNARKKRGD